MTPPLSHDGMPDPRTSGLEDYQGQKWTLIGVRNPNRSSGTHISVVVDDPPLEAGERIEVVRADALAAAVETLEHIAHHGERPEDGEPCRRPPQDCAQDALDRLRER